MTTKKNILIAGGAGLIGRALSAALARDGHAVYVLSRSPQAAGLPPGVQAVRWDGRTSDGWVQQAGEADVIINLAGANISRWPWTAKYRSLIRSSRVNAGRAIVEALNANTHRPELVIQIAGVGFYGDQGDRKIDETGAPGTGFLASVSRDWEASTQPVTELGVRQVILRSGVVLAEKGGVLAPFLLQTRLYAGGPLGSGKQWISWIHIEDLVDIIRFVMNRQDASGIYNAAAPHPATNAEFGRTLARVLRRPYWLRAPAFALRLLLGGMSAVVLESQRVLPKRLLKMGFEFRYPKLQPALVSLLKK
jgi:uncharacterized protein (TIGR01777 family)